MNIDGLKELRFDIVKGFAPLTGGALVKRLDSTLEELDYAYIQVGGTKTHMTLQDLMEHDRHLTIEFVQGEAEYLAESFLEEMDEQVIIDYLQEDLDAVLPYGQSSPQLMWWHNADNIDLLWAAYEVLADLKEYNLAQEFIYKTLGQAQEEYGEGFEAAKLALATGVLHAGLSPLDALMNALLSADIKDELTEFIYDAVMEELE